jgi:hypothetical protein
VLFFVVVSSGGCSKEPANPSSPPASDRSANAENAEAAVREKFVELQKAIKAKDTQKLWGLLSSASRATAETKAKEIRSAYEKGTAEEKAKLEKESGLPGAELAKLTGTGILKTSRFVHKADEIAESTITRVTVEADTVTVYYDEPDGDHEKLHFKREDGQWKAWLTKGMKS